MGTTPGRVLFRARVPLASRGAVPRWPLLRSVGLAIVGAMVAALVTAASVAAREPRNLYVSPSGSDANPCTQTKPCATIGHAVGAAPAGSTVVVRRGTYHEAVVIPKRLRVVGHRATIDASGVLASVPGPLADQGIIGWGVLIVGPSAAGTTFQGFTVENAPAEGILAALTSNLSIVDNELRHNDVGATTTFDPMPFECLPQGEIPGDCGEALHLLSVSDSRIARNNAHDNVGGFLLTDEAGPTHGNLLVNNVARNNKLDCGFTLPSHNANAVADPTQGGVYDNTLVHNLSAGNGGAGIGMFAPFPGAAAYDNRVIRNVVRDNGEAGIAIHAHAPGQNVSGNVIIANRVSGNGVDADFVDPTTHIGIMIGSAAVPVDVTVRANRISNEDVGIYRVGNVDVHGLSTNRFASSVVVHVH